MAVEVRKVPASAEVHTGELWSWKLGQGAEVESINCTADEV
jgi:hypothetical protein